MVVIGYDSGKQQKAAIRDGSMAGAITQNPVGIGYETVEALKGKKLPKVIDTGFYFYDKSNIDDPKITAALYDLIKAYRQIGIIITPALKTAGVFPLKYNQN